MFWFAKNSVVISAATSHRMRKKLQQFCKHMKNGCNFSVLINIFKKKEKMK